MHSTPSMRVTIHKRNNMISMMKNKHDEFEETTVDGGKIVSDKFGGKYQVDADNAH